MDRDRINDAKALAIGAFVVMALMGVLIVVLYGLFPLFLAGIGGFAFLALCVGIDNVSTHYRQVRR